MNNWKLVDDLLKLNLLNSDVNNFKQWLISKKHIIIKQKDVNIETLLVVDFLERLYKNINPLSPSVAHKQERAWYLFRYNDIMMLNSVLQNNENLTDSIYYIKSENIKRFINYLVSRLPVELQTLK